ncbi:Kinesin motor domain [Popillia japonica]|uniref:Kinesin motor domain n=1 Tax=Popillia japonica TaxID=7064 RepID=A0AAW1MC38_POPJA
MSDYRKAKYHEAREKPTMVKRLELKCKNAKVYFRILPLPKICWENVKVLDDKETIYVRYRQEIEATINVERPSYWCFKTDGVFYNNTQSEVYDTIVPELLEHVIKGRHGIIFCFGQTGTGKSLTTIGIENSYEDRGIIPRLITNLFGLRDEFKNTFKMCFKLSYIEATRTHIRDLLKVEETNYDIHSINEVSSQYFTNEPDMLKAVYKAEGRKTLSRNTAYNSHVANSVLTIIVISKHVNDRNTAYNSHVANSVLTIIVISKHVNDSSLVKTYSKIHIVDLAGADTVGNKPSMEKNVAEIATGNLAKSQLEQFLLVLIENIPEQIIVKQRLNILIHYLKDCLNASSMLRFIGHIRVDDENLLITLSMLRFGQIVRGLKPKRMHMYKCDDAKTKIKYLEDELRQIKRQKDIDSMIRNEDLRDNLSDERINQLRCLAEDYLQNRVDEIAVISLADIQTILQVFKTLFKQLESEKSMALDSGPVRYDAYPSRRSSSKSVLSQKSSRKQSGKSRDSLRQSRPIKEKVCKSVRSLTARSVSRGSNKSGENKADVIPLSRLDVLNNVKSKESLTKEKSTKRSKILRKPSGSRRKSSTDSQHEKILEETMFLPEVLPSPSDAWRSFIESDLYDYKELKEQIDEHECQIKRLNARYVNGEVKKLKTLREWLDLCEGKLCQLKRQQELVGTVERNEQGDIIRSEQQIACDEMVYNGKQQLVQQQETCLTIQTELQLYLQLYNEKKKKIDESFDAFCAEKYQTAVSIDNRSNESEVAVYTLNKNNDDPLLTQESLEIVKDEKINKLHAENNEYEQLKLLAAKQREQMLRQQYLNRRWVRSCRNQMK